MPNCRTSFFAQTTNHQTFCTCVHFWHLLLIQGFRKHPLELDVDEANYSDTESDEEECEDSTGEHKQDDTPLGKEDDIAGIGYSPSHHLHI